MRCGRAKRNQRGAGGSGHATPPDGCGEAGQPEATGACRVGADSGDWAGCELVSFGCTAPGADGSAGLTTTFGFALGLGLGLGFGSVGSAVACLGAGLDTSLAAA